jgi:hypothetical protein
MAMEDNINTTELNKKTYGKRTSEVTVPSKPPEEVMNLHSFIKVKGYSIGIEHRMERNSDKSEKTLVEWENIYTQTMSRITK